MSIVEECALLLKMDSLHGGTGCNKYNNCGWFSYESCIPASATYGFQSDESGVTCNKGYTYATCGLIISYSSCSGDVTYNS